MIVVDPYILRTVYFWAHTQELEMKMAMASAILYSLHMCICVMPVSLL